MARAHQLPPRGSKSLTLIYSQDLGVETPSVVFLHHVLVDGQPRRPDAQLSGPGEAQLLQEGQADIQYMTNSAKYISERRRRRICSLFYFLDLRKRKRVVFNCEWSRCGSYLLYAFIHKAAKDVNAVSFDRLQS